MEVLAWQEGQGSWAFSAQAYFFYQTCLRPPLCHVMPRGMTWNSYRAASLPFCGTLGL